MHAHYHFVTGRLAERSLRRVVESLAKQLGFAFSIDVLPITVAALLTPKWIAPRLKIPESAEAIILPGYCDQDLSPLAAVTQLPIYVGPRDLRALPEYFGQQDSMAKDYGDYAIEIIAEINHAPRMTRAEILQMACALRDEGADIIDIGCEPGHLWQGVGDCVRALREEGLRVSIDSLNADEISAAVQGGAELVLSVNSSNRDAAADWGCEVVVIPDDPKTLAGFDTTIEMLSKANVPLRLDPVVEPIGCGFAESLGRCLETRRRYLDAEMMMGIGNLTELTDVDSAGVNVLLLGFCEELRIGSVLTTQVINWARSSVKECHLARRLVHFAVKHGIPPKHLETDLVVLRDEKIYEFGHAALAELAANLKDDNYRVFAEGGLLHLIAADLHIESENAFDILHRLMANNPKNMDPAHAFYLGYELAKATTALTLGKQYNQDEALDWGFLTRPEERHRQRQFPEN